MQAVFADSVIKSQLKARSKRELQRQNSRWLNAYEQYLTVINFWSAHRVLITAQWALLQNVRKRDTAQLSTVYCRFLSLDRYQLLHRTCIRTNNNFQMQRKPIVLVAELPTRIPQCDKVEENIRRNITSWVIFLTLREKISQVCIF